MSAKASPRSAALMKRQAFAKALIAFKFDTQAAAISVGCSPKSAASLASQMICEPGTQALIQGELDKLFKKHDLTTDKVVTELKALGFSNMGDYVRIEEGVPVLDFSTVTREQMAAVASIEVHETFLTGDSEDEPRGRQSINRRTSFKLHPKHAALQDLLKFLTANGRFDPPPPAGTVINNYTQVNIGNLSGPEAEDAYASMMRDVTAGAPPALPAPVDPPEPGST